ncbi:MAG: MipA/OmpV family protein [Massilia sp.]
MTRFLLLALACLPAVACAQTPAANRMPDGSRDLYIGLGAQVAPRYAGADADRTRPLPVLQFAWSNGVFVSGASVGWHLSSSPTVEFGPLLAWHARRDADGDGGSAGGASPDGPGMFVVARKARVPDGLNGMDLVDARVLGGAFFNYYFTPDWRLTNNLLAGGGKERNGVVWRVGVQRIGIELGRHHSVALSAGLEVGNRAWNQTWSGVSETEAIRSGYAPYQAGAALRSVQLGVRWNWSLSPSWLLTSGVEASRLVDVGAHSPLAVRPTGVKASTALAWRF